MVYSILEQLLYSKMKRGRKKNIYCIKCKGRMHKTINRDNFPFVRVVECSRCGYQSKHD